MGAVCGTAPLTQAACTLIPIPSCAGNSPPARMVAGRTLGEPSLESAGREVLAVGGASELLADQPGQVQQSGPRPVVGHDVLRLPGGVAADQDNVADLPTTADLGRVVLQEAVLAVRAGEVELLGVIERADAGHDGTDGLGALHDAVHRRALYGDVAGQAVQPDRMVVGGRDADAVEAGDICRRASLGERFALNGHERFLS